MKILFVCLGNICRSPSAEAVFRKHFAYKGVVAEFDSAGTADYHVGERSDARSIKHAEKRGYEMTHLARQVHKDDFKNFDLILAMDSSNLSHLRQICPDPYQSKVQLITDYCSEMNVSAVPDPYHGDVEDFEHVLDILEDCVEKVLQIAKK